MMYLIIALVSVYWIGSAALLIHSARNSMLTTTVIQLQIAIIAPFAMPILGLAWVMSKLVPEGSEDDNLQASMITCALLLMWASFSVIEIHSMQTSAQAAQPSVCSCEKK